MVRNPRFPIEDQQALWRQSIERRLATLERAGRLPHSSIGSGGLSVKDGGSIIIEDSGGDPNVELSSDGLEVNGGQVVAVAIDSDFQTFDSVPVALSSSYTTYLTKEFAPPSWATQVQVVALAEAEAANASGAAENFRCRLDIEGAQRNQTITEIPDDGQHALTAVAFQTLTSWTAPISIEGMARRSLASGTYTLGKFQLSTMFIATVA